MGELKITIGGPAGGAPDYSGRSVSRFQRLKLGAAALLGLSAVIAFILAAFVIGLVLAVPLVVFGFLWLLRLAWHGKTRSRE